MERSKHQTLLVEEQANVWIKNILDTKTSFMKCLKTINKMEKNENVAFRMKHPAFQNLSRL